MDAQTHELIAGYALDALDESERVEVERLLATSEEARAELRSLSQVTAALAVGVVGPEPPADLRERIVSAARSEGRVVVPFERPARKRAPIVPLLSVAAAAAAVLAVGLGAWSVSLRGELDDTRSALTVQERATSVLADPAASEVALAAGDGRLVVDAAGQAVLVVDGLAPVASDETYQVWVVENETPRSAGLFAAAGTHDVVLLDETVSSGAVVAVTREPAGGSPAPTSTPLVASNPV
jgi:anti-sigma-K factor RskA